MSAPAASDLLAVTMDFCARVTASATHEIKNELAVMNEQARLAQEMMAMASQGREPDLAKLEMLLGRIVARVGSADQAVRRLNRFAHSADLEHAGVEAAQAVETTVGLFGRMAAQRRVTLELKGPIPPAALGIRPVMLEQAIWACLMAVADAAKPGGSLEVGAQREGDRLQLSFTVELEQAPVPPAAEILDPLGATVTAGAASGLVLSLPLDAKESRT